MNGIIVIAFVLLQLSIYVHAAPPIEACSHDSILIEDTCQCDPKQCSKPPCQFELKISAEGTNRPGNCCTTYTCEGCPKDAKINGTCPCAPGAILNSKNKCECLDEGKSLINNECICDPNRCQLPQICEENYVSVTKHDECCSTNTCIKCPGDSFAQTYSDEAVEDKCVCFPCKPYECDANEKVVIIQPGTNFPGKCCDIYKCEKETTCTVDDVVYKDEEMWETPDAQKCKCQGGISFCSKINEEEHFQSCHNENKIYKHNESWDLDNCTSCTCFNGEAKCIAHVCEVSEGHVPKPVCQPFSCSKECRYGYKLNKRGCKICKCNYPYKYDDILQKYNITNLQLKGIVDEFFARNKTESPLNTTTATTTDASNDVQSSNPIKKTDGFNATTAIIWFFIGFFICLIVTGVVYVIRCFNHRNKGTYDPNPQKESLFKNNNYYDPDRNINTNMNLN